MITDSALKLPPAVFTVLFFFTSAWAFASAMVSPKEAPIPTLLLLLLLSPARSALAPDFVTTFWFTFAVTSLTPVPEAVSFAFAPSVPIPAR